MLQALRQQLDFLRQGGYRQDSDVPWRPRWIFLDSPICRRGSDGRAGSCSGCPLALLAPNAPALPGYACHALRLKPSGRTLGSLQREGNLPKLEREVETWLKTQIEKLSPLRPAPPAGVVSARAAEPAILEPRLPSRSELICA